MSSTERPTPDDQRIIEAAEKQHPGLRDAFRQLIDANFIPPQYFRQDNEVLTEFEVYAAIVRPVVDGNYHGMELIASGSNLVNALQNSFKHAEIIAMESAMKSLGSKHLENCILLTTIEPCSMCAGAIGHANISGVVFARSQAGMRDEGVLVGGVVKPFRNEPEGYDSTKILKSHNPQIWVIGGYMQDVVRDAMYRSFDQQSTKLDTIK